jgi:hypothetical protein
VHCPVSNFQSESFIYPVFLVLGYTAHSLNSAGESKWKSLIVFAYEAGSFPATFGDFRRRTVWGSRLPEALLRLS